MLLPFVSLCAKGKIEFSQVIKRWAKLRIPYNKLFPELPNRKLDPFTDLMNINMQTVMNYVQDVHDSNNKCFGYLPLMCKASVCQLSALNAQSFAERMISCANLIVTNKRTLLCDNTLNKLTVLRMNKIYMEYSRKWVKLHLLTYQGFQQRNSRVKYMLIASFPDDV